RLDRATGDAGGPDPHDPRGLSPVRSALGVRHRTDALGARATETEPRTRRLHRVRDSAATGTLPASPSHRAPHPTRGDPRGRVSAVGVLARGHAHASEHDAGAGL